MNNEKEQKKEYESPKMEVIELLHKAEILGGSCPDGVGEGCGINWH